MYLVYRIQNKRRNDIPPKTARHMTLENKHLVDIGDQRKIYEE